MLNCALLMQTSCQKSGKKRDRGLFYNIAWLIIARLIVDIQFRQKKETYQTLLGFFVVCEFAVLDIIIQRMHKYSTTSLISIIMACVALLVADLSYTMQQLLPMQDSHAE